MVRGGSTRCGGLADGEARSAAGTGSRRPIHRLRGRQAALECTERARWAIRQVPAVGARGWRGTLADCWPGAQEAAPSSASGSGTLCRWRYWSTRPIGLQNLTVTLPLIS